MFCWDTIVRQFVGDQFACSEKQEKQAEILLDWIQHDFNTCSIWLCENSKNITLTATCLFRCKSPSAHHAFAVDFTGAVNSLVDLVGLRYCRRLGWRSSCRHVRRL